MPPAVPVTRILSLVVDGERPYRTADRLTQEESDDPAKNGDIDVPNEIAGNHADSSSPEGQVFGQSTNAVHIGY